MAESRSATRGRQGKRKSFAAIIAGPHYWISVKTKSGRVVRIPIEGKSRRKVGKGKAGKATVRPFGGTAGRDVQYRAKGQGGAAKPAIAPRSERSGYDRRNVIDTALGRSPAESRSQLAMQARARRALQSRTTAKRGGAPSTPRPATATPTAPAPSRTIAPRSERPGYDRRNAIDTALGRDPAEVRRTLAVQARGKRALKPKTGDAAARETQALRRAEAAKVRAKRARRLAERAAAGGAEIGGRYDHFGGRREFFDARKNPTPAYREFIKKQAAQRSAARPATPSPGLTAEQQRNRERAQAAIAKSVDKRLASAQKRAAVSLGTGKPSDAFDAVDALRRRKKRLGS